LAEDLGFSDAKTENSEESSSSVIVWAMFKREAVGAVGDVRLPTLSDLERDEHVLVLKSVFSLGATQEKVR
jgi:hypothetical protein